MAANGAAGDKPKTKSLDAQIRTYGGMISVFKWGTVAVALVVALVIWLIAG
jgi:hypothetical protein